MKVSALVVGLCVAAAAAALSPGDTAAQGDCWECYGGSPYSQECLGPDQPAGYDSCNGAGLGCTVYGIWHHCELTLDTRAVGADGSVFRAAAGPDDSTIQTVDTGDGVVTVVHGCTRVVLSRTYSEAAQVRIREASARLEI